MDKESLKIVSRTIERKKTKNIYTNKQLISTVHSNRYPVFRIDTDQSDKKLRVTDKIPYEKLNIIDTNTEIGSVCYSNMDQKHKDILESIFFISEKIQNQKIENKGHIDLALKFNMKDLIEFLECKHNYTWLYKKIYEIHSSFIYIKTPKFSIKSNIIDSIVETPDKQFLIIFTQSFANFIKTDYRILTNQETLKNILKIKSNTVKAIARYMITHRQIKISFSKLLSHIYNKKVDKRLKYKIQCQMYKYITELNNIGIEIQKTHKDIFLTYTQNPKNITIDYSNLGNDAMLSKADQFLKKIPLPLFPK